MAQIGQKVNLKCPSMSYKTRPPLDSAVLIRSCKTSRCFWYSQTVCNCFLLQRSVPELDSVKATKDDASLISHPKRPASSATFSFRPSPLNSAARGFSLRQSSLQPGVSDLNPTSLNTSSSPEASSNDTREESTSVEKSELFR